MSFSKIKSIKKIGVSNTYDLEVPTYHNFLLANGILSHNSHDVDTRYGVDYITAWQNFDDIPERILKQGRYIFVPRTADVATIKSVLISTGMVRNIQRSVNKAIELKRQLKRHRFSWIVIDRMEATMDLILPLPPLSHHLETAN